MARNKKVRDEDDGTLGQALIRKMTGRAPGAVEREAKKSLGDRLKWLESKFKGSDKQAAKAAGLSVSTWRRWRSGKQKPKPESIAKLDRATREALVPKGRRKRISNATGKGQGLFGGSPLGGAHLSGWVTISSDDRPRELNLGGNLPPGRLDAVVQAFIEHGEQAAVDELKAAIGEYLHVSADDVHINKVDGFDWEPLRAPKETGEDHGAGGTDDQGEIF